MKKPTFDESKEKAAKDCEAIAKLITDLAANIRAGDMKAFEAFWIEGGTEEGDAKILALREYIVLRYVACEEARITP